MSERTRTIHEAVRQRYGAAAKAAAAKGRTRASCGCGCQHSDGATGPAVETFYDPGRLAELGIDTSGLSMGCGDPVAIAGLKAGETVLDLGSGAGLDCFLAGQRVGEGGRVIGVDFTVEQVERANEISAGMGARNVEFRMGPIEALPVEDDSVDVVISNCVISLSPDKPSVFREALRVLKPGGRMSLSDIVVEGEFPPAVRADLDKWAACVGGAVEAESYVAMMKEAGFVDVRVVDRADAEGIVGREEGMPRLFSARVTARKPVSGG